eukprot:8929782-Lingulodinium_polyedra.AAC.1
MRLHRRPCLLALADEHRTWCGLVLRVPARHRLGPLGCMRRRRERRSGAGMHDSMGRRPWRL